MSSLSVVAGARSPEFPAGRSMRTSAVFEVPAAATGLRAVFHPVAAPGVDGAVVTLG